MCGAMAKLKYDAVASTSDAIQYEFGFKDDLDLNCGTALAKIPINMTVAMRKIVSFGYFMFYKCAVNSSRYGIAV